MKMTNIRFGYNKKNVKKGKVDWERAGKQGGNWERSRELGTETIHFKLARVIKRVLKPCDPKVCQSKLEMGTNIIMVS